MGGDEEVLSTSVDNRVVQMEFDNAQFEAGISQSLQTLQKLDSALNDLENAGGFKGLSSSINSIGDDLEDTFSFRGVTALTTFQKIASSVVDTVVGAFSSLKNNYLPVNFIDQALSGGSQRASNIEDAKFRLEGLGAAWNDLSKDINYAVQGTAYGLDSAAVAASQLVASGIEYGETFGDTGNSPMAKALRGISGVAAMTNTSYDEIANIFTTVAGNGKLMTKELRMMSYRGLNVAATMANEFNKVLRGSPEALEAYSDESIEYIQKITKGAYITESFIRDNMKDGIIYSDLFFEAMDHAFGAHATEANKTYAGSLSNVRAALSRLGAVYFAGTDNVQGHMDNMVPMFNALRLAIDAVKNAVTPLIEEFLRLEDFFVTGFTDLFNGVVNVEGPINTFGLMLVRLKNIASDAFSKIFPDITIENIIQKMVELEDKLKKTYITAETYTAIQGIFEGILSVLHIIKTVIDDIVFILEPWFEVLNSVGGEILGLLGDLGFKISDLDSELSSNDGVTNFIYLLRYLSETLAEQVISGLERLKYIIQNFTLILQVLSIAAMFAFVQIAAKIAPFIETFVSGFNKIIKFAELTKQRVTDAFNERGIIGALEVLFAHIRQVPNLLQIAFGPFVKLVKGIILTALQPLIDQFELLKQYAHNTFEKIKTDIWNSLPEPLQNAILKVKEFVELFKSGFGQVFEYLKLTGLRAFEAFGTGGFEGAIGSLTAHLKLLPSVIKTAFGPIIDEVKAKYEEITGYIGEELETLKQKIYDSLPEPLQDAITKVESFIEKVKGCFGTLGTYMDEFAGLIEKDFNLAGMDGAMVALGDILDMLPGALTDAFSPLTTIVTDALDEAKQKFDDFVAELSENKLVKAVKKFVDDVKSAFDDLTDGLTAESFTATFESLFEELSRIFDEFVGNLTDGTFLESVQDLFDTVIEYVKSTVIGQFVTSMWEAGKSAIDGLITGFTDGSILSTLWGAITDLVGSKESGKGIIGFFANLVGWHSPWTIMVLAGAAALAGLALGLKDESGKSIVISAIEGIVGWVTKAFDDFKGAAKEFGTWVGGIFDKVFGPIIPYFEELWELLAPTRQELTSLWETIKPYFTLESIWGYIKDGITIVQSFLGTVAQVVSWLAGKAIGVFKTVGDTVIGFFESLSGTKIDLGALAKKIGGPFEALYNGLTKVFDKIKGIKTLIGDAANGKFGEVIQNAVGLGALLILPGVLLAVLRAVDLGRLFVIKVNGKISDFIKSIQMTISFFTGFAKAIQMSMSMASISKFLISLAVLIGVVGYVVKEMAVLKPEEFKQASEAFTKIAAFILTMTILIAAITMALGKLNQGDVSTSISKAGISFKRTGSAMTDAALTIAAIAVGAFLLVKAFSSVYESLKGLNEDQAKAAQRAFIVVAAFATILGVGAGVIAKFQNNAMEVAKETDKLITVKPKLLTSALTILAIVFGVKMLIGAFKELIGICDAVLNGTDENGKSIFVNGEKTLDKAFTVLTGLVGMMALLAAFSSFTNLSSGLGMLAIVASIYALKYVFTSLIELGGTLENLEKEGWKHLGYGALAALVAVSLIFAATKLAGENAAKGGLAVLLITGSVILIMKSFSKLAEQLESVSWDGVLKGIATVAAIILSLGGLIALTNKCATSFKSAVVILALGALIVVLGLILAAMTVCAKLAPEAFLEAAAVMGALIILVTFLIKATAAMKDVNMVAMIALAAMLGVVSAALVVLTFRPWDSILLALLAMAGVLGVTALVIYSLSKLKGVNLGPILATIGILVAVAIALGVLSSVCDPEGILTTAEGLGVALLALAAVLYICSKVGLAAPAAISGLALLAIFIGGLAALMLLIGGLSKIKWVDDAITKGCEKLVELGEAVGGFIKGALNLWDFSDLPHIGELLSQFADNCGPFFDIMSSGKMGDVGAGMFLLVSSLGQVVTNAAWQTLVEAFTKQNSMDLFAQNLAKFGSALKDFNDIITADGGIKQDAVDYAVKIGEELAALEKSITQSQSIIDFFINRDDLGDFGEHIKVFAEGINAFAGAIPDGMDDSIAAAEELSAFLIALNDMIPTTGSVAEWFTGEKSFSTFGSNVSDFGVALRQFSYSTQNIKADQMDAVISAAKKLVDLGELVSGSDASKRNWLFGTNDFSNFGQNINGFAEKIITFSNKITGINSTSMTTLTTNISTLVNSFTRFSAINTTSFENVCTKLGNADLSGIDKFINSFTSIDVAAFEASVTAFVTSFTTDLSIKATEFEAPGKDAADSYRNGLESEATVVAPLAAPVVIAAFTNALIAEIANGSMETAADDACTGFSNGISAHLDIVKNAGIVTGQSYLDGFKEVTEWGSPWGTMLKAGADAISGLIEGLQDSGKIAELEAAAADLGGDKDTGTGILGAFARAVGWGSPWTEFIDAGEDGLKGVYKGITDENLQNLIMTASKLLGRETVDSLVKSMSGEELTLQSVCKKLGLDIGEYMDEGFNINFSKLLTDVITGKAKLNNILSTLTPDEMDTDYGDYVNQKIKEYEEAVANATKTVEEGDDENKGYGGSLDGVGSSAGSAAKSTKDLAEEAKKHENFTKHEAEAVKELTKMLQSADKELSDTDAEEAARLAIEELARTFGKSADDIADDEEDLEELFNSMYDTVKESIDGAISYFDEFKVEASGSAKDLISNMKSNLTGMEDWGEALATLAMRGFAPKLIEELQAAGPTALNQANQLRKASTAEMMEINALVAKETEAVAQTTAKVIAAMAYATKNQASTAKIALSSIGDDAKAAYSAWGESIEKLNGIDISKAVNGMFGNIDINNRQVIEWTEEKVEGLKDVLVDWTDDVESMVGTVSTILGSSAEYDGVEIAFSPMLQTSDGAKVLDKSTVDKYIWGLIEKAGENWNSEDLLRLDTEGLEIDGITVKNILADIGESALNTGEIMHTLASDDELSQSLEKLSKSADEAGLSFEDYVQAVKDSLDPTKVAAEQIQEIASKMDALEVKTKDLKTTIKETVNSQIDAFAKFEKKNDLSTDELLSNMRSQKEGVSSWGAMFANVVSKNVDGSLDGLINKLAELGPSAYDTMAAVNGATAEQLQEMGSIFNELQNYGEMISQIVGNAYQEAGMQGIRDYAAGATTEMASLLATQPAAFEDLAYNDATGFENGVMATWQQTVDNLVGPQDAGLKAIRELHDSHSPSLWFEGLAEDDCQGYINGIMHKEGAVLLIMQGLGEDIINKIGEYLTFDKGHEFGLNFASGIEQGIYDGIESGVVAATAYATAISNAISSTGEINSPSKLWRRYGLYFDQGLALGLEDGTKDSVNSAKSVAMRINDALTSTLNDDLNSDLRPTITPVLDLTDVQNGLGNMNSMMNHSTLYARSIAGNVGSVNLTGNAMANLANAINGMSVSGGGVGSTYNITINTQPGQNSKEIADMVIKRLDNSIARRKAAYA